MKVRFGVDVIDEHEIPSTVAVFTENVGGCAREFAITAMRLSSQNENVRSYYFSVTDAVEEVKDKISLTFPKENPESVLENVEIVSFAEAYFEKSAIPMRWIGGKEMLESMRERRGIMGEIINAFDNIEENSFIFFDSLTDLVRLVGFEIKWRDLIDFIKGLKKVCKRKESIVAFHYSKLPNERENELLDQFDIVVDFELSYERGEMRRWMYIRKFSGLMPFIERSGISRFEVKLDPFVGAVISRVHRVI